MNKHEREETLATLKELYQLPGMTMKATTIAVIVDASAMYIDQHYGTYTRKLNVIDPTFNIAQVGPVAKCTYLTVYIQSQNPAKIPNPKRLGDIIYLKRFKFAQYNGQLQAFNHRKPFCSWTLFDGSPSLQSLFNYQTSKEELKFNQTQLYNIRQSLRELRKFSHNFLSSNSVLALHPFGYTTKDADSIVKVLHKSEDGYLVTNGEQELYVPLHQSHAEVDSIAKLRSIVRIVSFGNSKEVICNQYSSLLSIGDFSYDAQRFYLRNARLKFQDPIFYTTLAELRQLPLVDCKGKQYNVKIEVSQISPTTFQQAVQYYQKETNILKHSEPTSADIQFFGYFRPVYNIKLVCFDYDNLNLNQIAELFLFSYDGKGKDFLPLIKLDSDLTFLSSGVQENYLYQQRVNELLNALEVRAVVEVMFDQQGKERILRLIQIININ